MPTLSALNNLFLHNTSYSSYNLCSLNCFTLWTNVIVFNYTFHSILFVRFLWFITKFSNCFAVLAADKKNLKRFSINCRHIFCWFLVLPINFNDFPIIFCGFDTRVSGNTKKISFYENKIKKSLLLYHLLCLIPFAMLNILFYNFKHKNTFNRTTFHTSYIIITNCC